MTLSANKMDQVSISFYFAYLCAIYEIDPCCKYGAILSAVRAVHSVTYERVKIYPLYILTRFSGVVTGLAVLLESLSTRYHHLRNEFVEFPPKSINH